MPNIPFRITEDNAWPTQLAIASFLFPSGTLLQELLTSALDMPVIVAAERTHHQQDEVQSVSAWRDSLHFQQH